jgi:ribosomal protein S18 acetylase RimI-like enzyme
MDDLQLITKEGEPNPDDKESVRQGLLSYHRSKGHPRGKTYFSVILKNKQSFYANKEDNVLGGVLLSIEWNGLHIESLWVDESLRNKGWGSKLMETAEKEGVKRGCTFAYTDTFTWQAPEFYEKLGYTLYGKLENYPEGNSLSYYRKNLV